MNRHKLQILIAAGVFSSALLSGAAYAEDKGSAKDSVQVSTTTPKTSRKGGNSSKTGKASQAPAASTKKKTSDKSSADMGCSSANGCGNH